MLKSLARKLIPAFTFKYYYRVKRFGEQSRNQSRSVEEVFTEIYKKNQWGGKKRGFYSGVGSESKQIVVPYVEMVSDLAVRENFLGSTFVDLGCGDFRVGQQLLPLCSNYIGVDVVEPLIIRNRNLYGNASVSFAHLDIVKDELPVGEVCFIRQVFQHLSNSQIMAILPKLLQYKWVLISEHYPTENDEITPNLDQVQASDIRASVNSGVYLTDLPFNIPAQAIRKVLEIPSVERGKGNDPGVIRTFLYKPKFEKTT